MCSFLCFDFLPLEMFSHQPPPNVQIAVRTPVFTITQTNQFSGRANDLTAELIGKAYSKLIPAYSGSPTTSVPVRSAQLAVNGP